VSRAQLALRVSDLEASVSFYTKLFGVEPAKRRPGYANFAIVDPPLKLVLIQGVGEQETRLDHLGVEVDSTREVAAAAERLREVGLATTEESDTSCCYALQDKVWVHGPGREPWEVYVVKADAEGFGRNVGAGVEEDGYCGTVGCCVPAQEVVQGEVVAGCACGGQGCR